MDTSAERKKRKRENTRDVADRVRKCRAKKKKLKEDLLIKNYKNREAVRKHRSGIKHAGTRGKYKPRKTQYDEYGSPVTPAEKKMYQGLFKRTWYADGTRVQKKRFYVQNISLHLCLVQFDMYHHHVVNMLLASLEKIDIYGTIVSILTVAFKLI